MWYGDCEIDDESVSSQKTKKWRTISTQEDASSSPQREACIQQTFKSKTTDRCSGLALFGTVPPPLKFSIEQTENCVSCLIDTLKKVNPDAVMVYDIQDEPSRNGTQRPFPFFQTHEPKLYSKLLGKYAPNLATIVYRAMIPGQDISEFENWVHEAVNEFNVQNMVIVGGSSMYNRPLIAVKDATKLITEKYPDVYLGGITIPERHRDRGNEHLTIHEKCTQGIGFYTSQVVYNADNAIALLRDYDELCKQQGKEPIRLVFTFAPFGSESTVHFLRWLGVELPEGTVKRVISRPSLKARVEESVEICWENWKRILDASRRLKLSVPIGFSVESVSKSKMESEAAVDLFNMLKEEMETYYASRNASH